MKTEFIILVILYVSIMAIVIKILHQRDKKINLMKYEIDILHGPNLNVEEKLNYIIDNTFDEYRFYNLEYRDEEYIKEIDEKVIIQELCNTVLQRMSPSFLTQLCTYFNIDSLGDIIATKISMKVMEYRIVRNTKG